MEYRRWLFSSILVLAVSAAADAQTGSAERLENRQSNQQKRADQEVNSEAAALKEEARPAEHGPGMKMDGMEKAHTTRREGNRMGRKIERERSQVFSAPGALGNDSVPTDPAENRNEPR